MFEDRNIKVFFSLLQAGLWNKPIAALAEFPLTASEWNSLYRAAVDQTVEGLIFDGLQRLPKEFLPPRALLMQWLVRVEKIEQRNRWMNSILADQALFFEKANLQPILLKGQGLASCYANPLRRMCGDIDWYFPTKKAYQSAVVTVAAAGVSVDHTAGFSASYLWDGCEIELHQKMFDLYNPFSWRYLAAFENKEAAHGSLLSVGEAKVKLASPMVQSLQVNAHILKHLLSFGIGLRQLCDAACLYVYYAKELDGGRLKAIYSRLKLTKWIGLLHEILINYVGMPKQYLPFTVENKTSADWMMREIWQAGNFGFYDARYNQGGKGCLTVRQSGNQRLWKNFKNYLPYAPLEAISFPMVHFCSRFAK